MSSDDKKIKITGEVKIDQSQATKEVQELKKELDGFRASLDKIGSGIELVLRALASMASSMEKSTQEAKNTALKTQDITDAVKKATEAARQQKEETQAVDKAVKNVSQSVRDVEVAQKTVSAGAGILNGIWERIGHTAVDILAQSIAALVQLMISGVGRAREFGEIFDRMGARGVENIDALKLSVVNLAGAMGEDLLEVAKAVDFADSMGAGAESLEVARVALENYRITGMDVNRQIEISSRLIKAYNADVSIQADLIREVAQVSQTAHIRQEELWSGLTSVGPKIAKLGGDIKDLVRLTAAGLSAGIKSGDDGLQGMGGMLDSLIKPGKEFGEMLVKTGLIVTQTSPQWRALTATVDEQKRSFEALNAQLKEYKSESSQIGLLTTQTESLVKKYDALMAKKQSGAKLSYDEKKALLEVTRSLRENNEELSKYDKAGFIVENREFKRLGLIGQISERLQAAKQAQEDLNLKIQESEVKSQGSGSAIQVLNTQLAAMAQTMQTEIPAAIQAAVANNGLDAFIKRIAATPAALAQLPSQVQTLITSLAGIDMTAGSAAQSVADISMQAAALATQGSGSITMMQNNFSTLATTLMGPVASAFGAVAKIINEKLMEPFEDGTTILSRVSKWASDLGAEIIADFEDIVNGDMTLSDLFAKWIGKGIDGMLSVLGSLLKKFWDAMVLEFKTGKPDLEKAIAEYFINLAKQAIEAFRLHFVGFIESNLERPLQNFVGGLLSSAGTAQLGDRGNALHNAQAQAPYNYQPAYNTYVNGAGDPSAVATEVMRMSAQAERLGNSGARLR